MENTIFLDFLPPSVNSIHRAWKGRVIVSEEARNFYKKCCLVAGSKHNQFMLNQHDYYWLDICFYTPKMFKKNGTINLRSGDVDNMLKPLIDALFPKMGYDDAKVTKVSIEKKHGEREKTRISIFGGFYDVPELSRNIQSQKISLLKEP